MRVDIIDSAKALAGLRAEWEAVYEADPEAQFFLSWTWMAGWLPSLNRPWFVLAARPEAEDSAYAAFFPLWIDTKERKSGGFYNNLYMGGNYTADYTGFICRPEQEQRVLPAFADRLRQLNWTNLRLEFLRASERRTQLFLEAFPDREFSISEINRIGKDGIDNSLCPFASLPADWEAYLSDRLSANSRQKFRRLLRQIENSGEFRITHADRNTVGRDIDLLLGFWIARWAPEKGAQTDAIARNHRLMLQRAFEAGALFLPVLWQGERAIGALAILVDAAKRSFLFFMAGRDETFEGLPSGLALHAHSIRHAIHNGFILYDFLRGNEPYKRYFGVEERRVTSFVVTTKDEKNLGGRLDGRSLAFARQRSLEHQRAGRSLEAELGFRQVLQLDPQDAEALYGLGQILAKNGEHAAAIGVLRTLLGAQPDIVRAWFWLGRSLRVAGEFWEAVRSYCEGMERQPAPAGAYDDLGHMLLQLGQVDLAVATFEAARGLQPDLPDLDASLARARRQRAALSPEDLARRAADHAELCERIGRLGPIAAVLERDLRTARTPVAAWEHSGARSP
jgi:CelD/BcsL family acetyltransferase involved in cellulose biosynthesis